MENKFAEIKSKLPICQYLEKETGSEIKTVGDGMLRVNPCPFCGHNDCFTIYGRNQSFHCFSCEESGDIIHIEKKLQQLGSNFEAAESLARRYGLGEIQQFSGGSQPKGSSQTQENKDPIGSEKRQRHLRGLAAEFYHQQLLQNQEALNYQTQNRGHSLEILKHFKVGVGGGDLIGHVSKYGFGVKDLEGIGLVKRTQNGYRAYISNGLYVYPHWCKGEVLFFTLKDPAGKKKYQIKKNCADGAWLCLNQDILGKNIIYSVEGENDLLSIAGKAKQFNVIATIGNFNTSKITDYLIKHSTGKTYYLIFDRDAAGEKYTSKYAEAIAEGGGQALKIEIPAPYNDIDDFLRDTKDPASAFKRLIDNARQLNYQEKNKSVLEEFNSFQVLGELADERIALWSRVNKKVYRVTIRDLNLDKLDQIGGEEVTIKVCRKYQEGKIPFRRLKREIITEASKSQLGHPDCMGQGIHRLKEDRLLIVNGGDAWIWNGKEFVGHESPLIENKFIDWRPGCEWIEASSLIYQAENMNEERGLQVVDELLCLLGQWGFKGKLDHVLVCGWFLAQIVQSVWDWRPHLWFSGAQGSGKTQLTKLFEKIGGGLARRYEGQTSEAGIRTDLEHDSVLVTVDEFEKTEHREKILELCRSASRGGVISKGSANQTNIKYQIQHMFLLCSIEIGIRRAAENPRFLIIESLKDSNRNPEIPCNQEIEKLRIRIFAFSIWGALKAKSLIPHIKSFQGVDNRFSESLAVAFSLIGVCDSDQVKALNELIGEYLADWSKDKKEDFQEDEQALLESIMLANIRLPLSTEDKESGEERLVYDNRSVSYLIEKTSFSGDIHAALQTNGVKVQKDGIFFHPEKVKRELLQNTDWRGLSIREILLRVDGANSVRDRLSGARVRGVFIPYRALSEFIEEGQATPDVH